MCQRVGVPQRHQGPDHELAVALDATPLLGQRTGVGEFCLKALEALARRGQLDVAAFAVSWRRRQGLGPQLPAGVKLLDRPMPARPLHKSWSRWSFPPIEAFVGPRDVVHGTNFVVPPAWRAAMVVTVHDLTPVHFPEMVEPGSLDYPSLVKAAIGRGAWVHTPTRAVAREVVEVFGADPGRVRAVHHGAPVLRLEAGDQELAQVRRGLLPDWAQRYVLALGSVEPRKDLPGLVRAFTQVAPGRPGLALVVAGPQRWGSRQLDEAVAASAAGERVVRLGWVDELQRHALLRGAALLAYPSRYEGFGFPPLEAMQAGTPVVATRCPALVEVLGEAAELVEVGDTDALATALARILDDEGARSELVARGTGQVARYSWEEAASGLESLYREARSARFR